MVVMPEAQDGQLETPWGKLDKVGAQNIKMIADSEPLEAVIYEGFLSFQGIDFFGVGKEIKGFWQFDVTHTHVSVSPLQVNLLMELYDWARGQGAFAE